MKRFKRIIRQARQSLLQDRSQVERQSGDERRAVGDWVGAAKHYQRHVTQNPRDMGIWVQLGHALKESGQYDEAEAAYRSAHLIDDANADLFLSRGHLAKLRHDVTAAADFYNRSFLIDGNPDAARELGQLAAADTSTHSDVARLAGAVESVNEGVLVGWIVDPADMDRRAAVEILQDGVVLGIAHGDVERSDLVTAGLASRSAGFRFDLAGLEIASGSWISARNAETHQPLVGSPLVFKPSEQASAWIGRHETFGKVNQEDLLRRSTASLARRKLSIVVDFEGTDAGDAHRLLDSLEAQWCENWELLYDIGAKPSAAMSKLAKAWATNPRYRSLPTGSAGAARFDLVAVSGAARGDYVASIAHGAVFEPEAVYRILDAAAEQTDIIYWDDVSIGATTDDVVRLVTRPAFSWDHFLGHPDFFGSIAIRKGHLHKLSATILNRSLSDPRTVVDAVLASESFAHIPAMLERRQAPIDPTRQARFVDYLGHCLNNRLQPAEARPGLSARVTDTGFEITATTDGARDVVIILAGDDPAELQRTLEACLRTTLRSETDVVIVRGRETSSTMGRYLDRIRSAVDILNDEHASPLSAANAFIADSGAGSVTLVESGIYPSGTWHEILRGLVSRTDVGVAAPVLLGSGDVIQSSGVSVEVDRLVHSHQGVQRGAGPSRSLGWHHALVSRRNQEAAAGCIMMRKASYQQAGGLDPLFSGSEAIADLCLRLAGLGLATVVDPVAIAHSRKLPRTVQTSRSFRQRWAQATASGDPYHHPMLDDDFAVSDATHILAAVRLTSGGFLGPKGAARVAADPVPPPLPAPLKL